MRRVRFESVFALSVPHNCMKNVHLIRITEQERISYIKRTFLAYTWWSRELILQINICKSRITGKSTLLRNHVIITCLVKPFGASFILCEQWWVGDIQVLSIWKSTTKPVCIFTLTKGIIHGTCFECFPHNVQGIFCPKTRVKNKQTKSTRQIWILDTLSIGLGLMHNSILQCTAAKYDQQNKIF